MHIEARVFPTPGPVRDGRSPRHRQRMSRVPSYWQPRALVDVSDADPLEAAYADPREDTEE